MPRRRNRHPNADGLTSQRAATPRQPGAWRHSPLPDLDALLVLEPDDEASSEARREADEREDSELPFADAAGDEGALAPSEPQPAMVDLRHASTRMASLFDEPLLDDEDVTDSERDSTGELDERKPRLEAADPSDVDEGRQQAIKRLLAERVKKRLERERRGNTSR